MSFDDLLIHQFVIYRLAPTFVPAHEPPGDTDGDPILDGHGQPVMAPEVLATVDGLIQPRNAREVALLSQAGAVVSTHVGFMWPLAGLRTDCWIESGGVRYDITGLADAAGQGHHLALALQAVT